MIMLKDEIKIRITANTHSEEIARCIISAFLKSENPTVEELADIRCSVSEAVDNCVSHAYKELKGKDYIYISARLYDNREFSIEISDNGCGFDNIQWHREPMHTTCELGEHTGMGFTVMQAFMDSVNVKSKIGKGTTVLMRKKLTTKSEGRE